MRFILLVIIGCCTGLNLTALTSGDQAIKLENVSAVLGKVPVLTPFVHDERNATNLKIITVSNIWSDNTRNAMPIISEAAKQHNSTLLLANPVRDAVIFAKDFPDFVGAVVADPEGKNSGVFLGDSVIQPRTYVIDYKGKIIWDGETAELPQFLKDFASGDFDQDKQAKLSKLQIQLEKSMRSGNDTESAQISARALSLYPGHPAILRMRIYMLSSTNRNRAAWELLEEQSKQNSNKTVELMKLGLTFSNSEFAPYATTTLKALAKTDVSTAEWLNACWSALTIHQFDPELLSYLRSLYLPSQQTKLPASGTDNLALFHALIALTHYRVGEFEEAITEQNKAVEVNQNPEMKRLLNFYQQVIAQSKSTTQ